MSPAVNSTHILVISFNDQLWLLGGAFYFTYCKCRSRVMVQIVSVTLVPLSDPGVQSCSAATEQTIGLKLLISNLTVLPDGRVHAGTDYTFLRRPRMRIE